MRTAIGRIISIASIKDATQRPPKSKSQRPRGLLIAATKRGKKENDDQHEDRDQKEHKQLQAQEMQDKDHQNQDHND